MWKRERQLRGAAKIVLAIGFFATAIAAAVSTAIKVIVGGSSLVTAGAGAYDLYKAFDPELYEDFKNMLRDKGYLENE